MELAAFFDLMEAYARADDEGERQAVEDEVWRRWGGERAVFVLDMSGFSRVTRKEGVVHYLSMVRHVQLATEPIIARYDGQVVKFEADNCFAVFPTVLDAIRAAVAVNAALDGVNLMTDDDLNIHVSIGIDIGKLLLIEGKDFYGDPVNTASKLGEDLGGRGEILVSDRAMATLPPQTGLKSTPVSYEISGLHLQAAKIHH